MAKKILVIDDEPDILKLAIIRLESSGYEVLIAEDSEKALALLNKKSRTLYFWTFYCRRCRATSFVK